jgi:hypothetical protein
MEREAFTAISPIDARPGGFECERSGASKARISVLISSERTIVASCVEGCGGRNASTHPGVGPLTALAYELVIGTPERFHCGKQIASYVGLVPEEKSSGDRRRLGHISKQGNALLRVLLVEAAQVTVRSQPQWRSQFLHLAMRRGRKIAKVAMARKLGVHLYWMWRQGLNYGQSQKFGSHAGKPGNPDGEQ